SVVRPRSSVFRLPSSVFRLPRTRLHDGERIGDGAGHGTRPAARTIDPHPERAGGDDTFAARGMANLVAAYCPRSAERLRPCRDGQLVTCHGAAQVVDLVAPHHEEPAELREARLPKPHGFGV